MFKIKTTNNECINLMNKVLGPDSVSPFSLKKKKLIPLFNYGFCA